MKFEIKHHSSRHVLFSADTDTFARAVEAALQSGVSLEGADLAGFYLRCANLIGINFHNAHLRRANLERTNLHAANLQGANLVGANLSRANLTDANFTGALWRGVDLRGAKLTDGTRLPTGETWAEYLTESLPALLTSGGKSLDSFADHWRWGVCPMGHAFDAHTLQDVPAQFQSKAEQFVQLMDAQLIPWPLPIREEVALQIVK